MKEREFDINKLRVASPCHVAWDAMSGSDRVRNCDSCKINVFNISEMNEVEAESLIRDHEGRLCIRLYRRGDGTVITKECPLGLRAYRKRFATLAGAALTGILSLFSISFGQKQDKRANVVSQVEIVRSANEKLDADFSGTVLDPNGAVIPGAEIKLFKANEKKPLKTKSDDDGNFKLVDLAAEVYKLQVRFSGFKTNIIKEITVSNGETLSLRVVMLPASENVTVGIYAEEPLIDVTSSSVITGITRRQIESLPH